MIRVSLLEPAAPEWARALDHMRFDFYHKPAYVELSGVHEGAEPRALYAADGDRRMLLPLLVREELDATSPYGYPGPIGDETFFADALLASLERLREEGLVSIFVRLHPILNARPPTGVGTLVQHGDTVSIDLSLSSEAMWGQTRADHRNQINRALRLGHRAYIDETWAHYQAFKRMYQSTMDRVGADEYYHFDDGYFDSLRSALGDRLHLCVVDIGGSIAGAGLFVETGGLVQYHLSATDEAFLKDRPTKLMLHFARDWAKGRGNSRLHLGGGVGGMEDSLFDFKAGFSTERHRFMTLRLVANEARYADLVRARNPAEDTHDLTGFFPAYRAPARPPGR